VTGPLERYAAGFLVGLVEAGYRSRSAAVQLRLLAHLSRWLKQEGLHPGELGESQLERFRREHLDGVVGLRGAGGLVPLLGYLRGLGVVPPADQPARSVVELLLERYRDYLLGERGLTAETARRYVDLVQPFVATRVRGDGELDFAGLMPADVLGFLLAECRHRPQRSAKMLVTALRSLLVFLHVEGLSGRPLAQVVPSVAFWRLQGLPRGLHANQVRALLASCDTDTASGRRDLAILLLLVRLGMRRGEVARLRLDDIDWRAGELLVRGKGSRVERLPLPSDVGEALVAYLRDGRPTDPETRAVFMRVRAPRAAMTPMGITQVVVSASKRAGLGEVTAHRLRHTAASELLRHGAPLREVGQLLRHRTELTTTIYAKVDRDRLRELALPWPGGPS
jgi:integrase/recombinase XerD